MTVYVELATGVWGEMIADDDNEMHELAAKLGIDFDWYSPAWRCYQIEQIKCPLAVTLGAIPISGQVRRLMRFRRNKTGDLGQPGDVVAWWDAWRAAQALKRDW